MRCILSPLFSSVLQEEVGFMEGSCRAQYVVNHHRLDGQFCWHVGNWTLREGSTSGWFVDAISGTDSFALDNANGIHQTDFFIQLARMDF